MRIIFDHCTQPRKYADSRGTCLVLLEGNDKPEDVIKEFTKKREWYEQTYSNPKQIQEYTHKQQRYIHSQGMVPHDITYKGNLILFDTFRPFLD